ncbi:MAG: hypothetical protein CMI26_06480 [Opitutae bacterium]|nr:hypothetical protein [Opitutae bacterium]|tara:strand:+ start:2876 stop:3163 length:288 start_codon:yes stop_codon:yes gene_type:complete
MDPISVDANTSGSSKLRAPSRLPSSPIPHAQTQSISGNALTDIGKLADRVESSSHTIRPEEVERGKALLADPNWPTDSILDGLAEKLIENEEFGG